MVGLRAMPARWKSWNEAALFKPVWMASVIILALVFLVQVRIALAADSPLISADKVRINDVYRTSYVSDSNTVSIEVYLNDPTAQVKFGSLVTFPANSEDGDIYTADGTHANKDGSLFTVENYSLKTGTNSITVAASSGGVRSSVSLTVTYVAALSQGASYLIKNITTQKSVAAFGGSAVLELGKNNYLLDEDGKLAEDQSLTLEIEEVTLFDPPEGFAPMSPVYYLHNESDDETTLGLAAKLTIKYTNLGVPPERISIWRLTSGHDWDNALNWGGKVVQTTGTVTIPLQGDFQGYYAVFASIVGDGCYQDLPSTSWCYDPVSVLFAKGVMEAANEENDPWNYADDLGDNDTFGLDLGIRRGEFAFMVVRGLGLASVSLADGEDYSFADVAGSGLASRYKLAIETAARNGLVVGSSGGDMDWDGEISRQQAAAILVRAARLKLSTDENKVNAALKKAFSDFNNDENVIAPWARSSFLACYQAGYIAGVAVEGGANEAQGTAPMTRAQAAALVHRMMIKLKLL